MGEDFDDIMQSFCLTFGFINNHTTLLYTQVADRFGLERLKRLCELEMQDAINIDTAAHILYTADQHNAEVGLAMAVA